MITRVDNDSVWHRCYDDCRPLSPDDPRQFFFVRNSGLPRDTFDRPHMTADRWVFVVCLAAAVIVALAL